MSEIPCTATYRNNSGAARGGDPAPARSAGRTRTCTIPLRLYLTPVGGDIRDIRDIRDAREDREAAAQR